MDHPIFGPTGGQLAPEEELDTHPVVASDLPTPETINRVPPEPEEKKGYAGALVRAIKGIPPYIWVVNEHDEDISVVVSQFRPNRLLTGGELNASAAGGGLSLSTATFLTPATRKTLRPQSQDPEGSIGLFPLWTNKNGFGVISIFTGPEKTLFIENDQVLAGCKVHFNNKPNLKVVPYGEHQTKSA